MCACECVSTGHYPWKIFTVNTKTNYDVRTVLTYELECEFRISQCHLTVSVK